MSKLFLIISTVLCVSLAMAQQPRQYSFTHYNISSGLLSNQVSSVVQDAEGYIWTGTTDGLQRFDGIRYKTFRHNSRDSTTIPSNPVLQLLIDKKKNLWVLMSDGNVGIFNTKKFVFQKAVVKTKNEASITTALKQLITDEWGNVFLLLRGSEVLTWNEKANGFSAAYNFFKLKTEWDIGGFGQQPGTQKYWFVIPGGSIAIFNNATKQLSYPGNNVEKEPMIDALKGISPFHLFFDRQNRVWFITWSTYGFPYAHCYDLKTGKELFEKREFVTILKTYHELQGFFQQEDGTIWIMGVGVFAKFLEKEKQFELVHNGYINERSIAYEMVTSLCEDKEKNIWVSTDNNGLYRFNPANEYFTNIKHTNRVTGKIGDGSPMSFMPTRWGTILVGVWGDGLYHYDNNLNHIPTDIKGIDNKGGPFAWGMFASRDSNTIWISSQPGIYAIDQRSRSAKFYNPPVLENRTVRQIGEDKNGNLWLGMQHIGVFKWTAAKGKNKFDNGIAKFTAIPLSTISKITIDSKDYVWIATDKHGVYVINPDNDSIIIHFNDKAERGKKLPEEGVSCTLEYDDSTMLITTATRLIKYNRLLNRSSFIGTADMISGFIAGMEKDRNGYVWLTTTNGLYRINIQKRIFIKFNREDGLDNDHFILTASCALPDGRLLFGSTNHVIAFDPASIKINSLFPDVKVTDFKVMNKSLPVDSLLQLKEIELAYNENSLGIEFSTQRFYAAHLIKYKLEGLDKEWKMADKNNQAVYSYIPPGKYTFLLSTINEEGVESTTVTQLIIKVNAPFWKAWWFYALLVLLVISLLFWLDRQRMKRKQAIEKMRSDIADNLHQEVNTALNNINILSEMARLKADKDIEKSKEYIQQIHSKSNSMITAMNDMLWNISPENDSMQKIIERFKEHIDALKNRFGAEINLLADEKVEALKLNMKLRQHIFWFLKSGSTNIVRTGAANCNIYLGFEKPNLIYTIEFDSTNTDMQQLNNLLQRQELAVKLQEAHAVLNVQLHKAKSVIVLAIPVN